MIDQFILELKSNSVIDNPLSIQVQNASFQISQNPMWSRGYKDSNGVAILGNKTHGLTHFSYRNGNPDDYLSNILKQLREAGEEQLEAVVIGGASTHFKRIIKLLGAQYIPLGQTYWDISNEPKDLVILPTTREVILYSSARGEYGQGYIQLA